jgi:hypothetical protein
MVFFVPFNITKFITHSFKLAVTYQETKLLTYLDLLFPGASTIFTHSCHCSFVNTRDGDLRFHSFDLPIF